MNAFLSIIVVYNPKVDLLVKDICSFIKNVDLLIIWQNSVLSDDVREYISSLGNIIFAGNGINQGIPTALNYALSYAIKNGYDYLLTMDQDSVLENFDNYKNTVIKKNQEKTCIVGAYQTFLESKLSEDIFSEYKWVITSGTIFPIRLLNEIGGFETSFFIDTVDIEVCIRARKYGYKCYICRTGKLIQKYGVKHTIKMLNKTINYVVYSPDRIYGIFRNLTMLLITYRKKEISYELFTFSFIVIKSAVFEKRNRTKSLLAMLFGIIDGIRQKSLR